MPFQPGNPGGGRPKLPADLKEAREITFVEFQNIIHKLLQFSIREIQAVVDNPDTSIKELLIASIIEKALIEGDEKRTQFLLEKIFGKDKMEKVAEVDEHDDPDLLREIPSADLIRLIRQKE